LENVHLCPKCGAFLKFQSNGNYESGEEIVYYTGFSCDKPDCDGSLRIETSKEKKKTPLI